MGENPEREQGERGGEGRAAGRVEARLDRWLNTTVLRVLALGALVAAPVIVVAVALGAKVFTAGWGAAVVGSLTLAASLFAAAAATASVQAGRRSAAASADSARAGERSAQAGASSAEAARRAYGQQLYELARATHRDLTSGEVAAARDLLGSVGRRRRDFWPPEGSGGNLQDLGPWVWSFGSRGYASADAQLEDTRRAWFTVLWCFQRVLAAREVLVAAEADDVTGAGGARPGAGDVAGGEGGREGRAAEGPRAFLDRLVAPQVRFLNDELGHARAAIEEFFVEPLDDRDSAAALRELVELLLGKQGIVPGRWSLPLSTHAGEALRNLLHEAAPEKLVPEDLAISQYQALHCHLDHDGDAEAFKADRHLLAEKLRARRTELERPGGPEHTAIGDDPRAGGDLDLWASTYADPTTRPVPRIWDSP